jgi:hypothetical protein
MPNKLQIQQPKETKMEHDERETLNDLIREQVIQALGKPMDLRNVQVRKIWNDHYRVNVIVGESAASVSIAHSYFLVIDSEGRLIAATPKITKQYPVAGSQRMLNPSLRSSV